MEIQKQIVELAKQRKVPIKDGSRWLLDKMSGNRPHQVDLPSLHFLVFILFNYRELYWTLLGSA